jgi:hypothetical protein
MAKIIRSKSPPSCVNSSPTSRITLSSPSAHHAASMTMRTPKDREQIRRM